MNLRRPDWTVDAALPAPAGFGDRWFVLANLYGGAIAEWEPVLRCADISFAEAARAAARAECETMSFPAALVAEGLVGERDLHRAIASCLGLRFVEAVDPARLVLTDEQCLALLRRGRSHMLAKLETADATTVFVIAPDRFGWIRQALIRKPEARRRICVAAPSDLRRAMMMRVRPALTHRATRALFERTPDLSAYLVMNAWQGTAIGGLSVVFAFALALSPGVAWTSLHMAATLLFAGCIWLRLGAALAVSRTGAPRPPRETGDGPMPTYTVLVALYREAEVVPDLIRALDALIWPRGRLDVKLVCEADDRATINAIRICRPQAHIEIVEVPPSLPRTKPKALNYALPLSQGDFVVLYDAEDRPHPHQLIEAWQRFAASDDRLACLQAPLVVSNTRASLVSRLFGFEYSALFLGLLPWLAMRNPLLPLGGTSNHFRRSILEEVGAWDPHNVTEDADLGLRLARFGYRAETIDMPTLEPGPESIRVWLPQRRRWFKGWAQTWLVHMRHPGMLCRQLGVRSFCVAQVLFAGLLLSVLLHPLLLLTAAAIAADYLLYGQTSGWASWMFAIDLFCIVGGYGSFLLLGARTLPPRQRAGLLLTILLTPAYWMLLSLAAWGAIWELARRPHHWNKTPHAPVARVASAISAGTPVLRR